MSAEITSKAYVERFGPQRASFDGSIVVCLYGKPEFLYLQSAPVRGGAGIDSYEFIYVCNSPELTEILQREARICRADLRIEFNTGVSAGQCGIWGGAIMWPARHARSKRLLIVNPDVFPREAGWARTHTALVEGLPAAQTSLFGVPAFYDDGSLMHGGMHFEIDTGVSCGRTVLVHRNWCGWSITARGPPPGTQALLRARPVPFAVTAGFSCRGSGLV